MTTLRASLPAPADLKIRAIVEVYVATEIGAKNGDPDALWYVWIRVRRRVFAAVAGFASRKHAEAVAREVAADVRGALK